MPGVFPRRAAAAALLGVLGGCQQMTYPDGRVGFGISPANLFAPAASTPRAPERAADDPYFQQVVPTPTIVAADREFYEIGLLNLPAVLDRCVADAARGPEGVARCWALDIHGLIVNVSEMNVRHRPGVPGLDPASAKRRWLVYAQALGVPPDRYQLVENGTFQRVLAVADAPH